jgi:hypothetical protein
VDTGQIYPAIYLCLKLPGVLILLLSTPESDFPGWEEMGRAQGESAMTSSLASREWDYLNLDGISQLLSRMGAQLGKGQEMTRAEAVSLDRERQGLKNRYTSLLVNLDARFTRLKESLVSSNSGSLGSEELAQTTGVSGNRIGEFLLHRAKKLAAAIQSASAESEALASLKKDYRKLVRRFNALVKSGNLENRSARGKVRAALVEIAHSFQKVEKDRHNRDP